MPPQHAAPIAIHPPSHSLRSRLPAILGLAAALFLTGCATTSPDSNSLQAIRDRHLSDIRSDPLGAYLERNYKYPRTSNLAFLETDNADSKALASTALDYLGIKYRYGGNTPNTGFDCSGLVAYAAEKSLGLKLPRRSAELAGIGTSVKRAELKEGDLVFFNTLGRRFSHVGIYLGDSMFVHAPRTGAVVRIESIETAYWKKRYNGARRLEAEHIAALIQD
ncbi:C40 family peptidase [Paracandidimonas soli]|uniref:Cell wall-associated NlpC family hydrolase n=1 Tax=Paracandidimonas soli TaxID=1917182 RepID=A0A4R3UKQ2_9BURK|nr:cell wall-associated NlpC family hydrolase [Paracandidimonas soli]